MMDGWCTCETCICSNDSEDKRGGYDDNRCNARGRWCVAWRVYCAYLNSLNRAHRREWAGFVGGSHLPAAAFSHLRDDHVRLGSRRGCRTLTQVVGNDAGTAGSVRVGKPTRATWCRSARARMSDPAYARIKASDVVVFDPVHAGEAEPHGAWIRDAALALLPGDCVRVAVVAARGLQEQDHHSCVAWCHRLLHVLHARLRGHSCRCRRNDLIRAVCAWADSPAAHTVAALTRSDRPSRAVPALGGWHTALWSICEGGASHVVAAAFRSSDRLERSPLPRSRAACMWHAEYTRPT